MFPLPDSVSAKVARSEQRAAEESISGGQQRIAPQEHFRSNRRNGYTELHQVAHANGEEHDFRQVPIGAVSGLRPPR